MELARLALPAIATILIAGLSSCSKGEELVDPDVPLAVKGVKVVSTTPFKLAVDLEGAPRAISTDSVLVKVSVTGKAVSGDERPLAGDVTLTRGDRSLLMAEAVTSFTYSYKERLPARCQLPGEDDWTCTGEGTLDVTVEVTSYDGRARTALTEPVRFDLEVQPIVK